MITSGEKGFQESSRTNLTDKPVIVKKIQREICREEDIVRYIDAYGRQTVESSDPNVIQSVILYKRILSKLVLTLKSSEINP